MQAEEILTTCEGNAPPPSLPLFLKAARPSRELVNELAASADALRAQGRIDDACFLLDVALAARLAGRS